MNPVLVVQLARFGDLVQTKRLILSLCAEEGRPVHLCVDESLAGLAAMLYPGVRVHAVIAHGTGLAKAPALEQAQAMLTKNREVFHTLAACNFERVYNLNFSPLNFRVAALFDPRTVLGHRWQVGQESIGLWAGLAMRWSSMRRLGLNIADFWAWHHAAPVAPAQVNPQASGRGGGIGVVMAGRESRRSLPPKELAGIVATLRELRGGALTLLGSASEDRAARALQRELPARHAEACRNLCGKTSLSELPEVVGGLDLLVTPDTGTMHLAAHLGVPVLATFLSSAWCFETGPYGLGHTVLQAQRDCLPCLESRPCPTSVECLQPFADNRLHRYLATGDARHLPEGLVVLDSSVDALGVNYRARAGLDEQEGQRSAFRAFLSMHLGLGGGKTSAESAQFAQRFYAERDWLSADPALPDFSTRMIE